MEWVFFGIGCAALFFALISFLLGEFTDAASGVTDWVGDHIPFFDGDHEVGFSKFLNMGATLGFLAGFGFVGAFVMVVFDTDAVAASGWGLLGGVIFGLILGGFWVLLKRSEGTVGYKLQDLVGKECTVSERIYPDSVGKIVCDIHNMQVWHPAKTLDGGEVARGERVRIQSVTGNMLFVTRISKEGG
jgi:membrane-bound ClpP family serine protease